MYTAGRNTVVASLTYEFSQKSVKRSEGRRGR